MAKKCIKIRSQYVSSTIYNTQSRKDSKTEEYGQEISGCKVKKHSWVALNRLGLLLANTSQLTRNPLFDVKRRTLKLFPDLNFWDVVKTGACHASCLSCHPLTVHHASLNYWLMGKEQYSGSSTKQPSAHFLCCRFVQPLACPFYPYPTWRSICCAQWQCSWQLRKSWYRDGARLPYPEASHDIDLPGLLSRDFSPSHLAKTGIWSEDDWPLPGDTVKQQKNKELNDKPKTKKTITVPAKGEGEGGCTDFKCKEDRIGEKKNPPPPPKKKKKKNPWTKNFLPKNPMINFQEALNDIAQKKKPIRNRIFVFV